MIRLEEEHIDHLYDFVRRHFVPWYDLQTELVDHLASGIEQLSETYPEKSFEQLLDMEFKKFGVHGFESVVEKRRNALAMEYYKLVLKRMISFFKWPVILESVLITVVLYFLVTLVNREWLWLALSISIFIIVMVGFIKLWSVKKRKESLQDRKWLLQEIMLNGGGSGVALLLLPLQLGQFHFTDHLQEVELFWVQIFITVAVVFYLRAIQVVCWVIPGQIDSILEERYNAYKFSK